jgi:hypothetical protein
VTAQEMFTGFERAQQNKQRLRQIIADVIEVADGLKAASAQALRNIDARVASDAFRVMVVGQFKRGKSTMINAMLGAAVLPAYARPATAVLTELRWSATPTAVLYPANGGKPVQVQIADLIKHITIPKGVRQGAAEASPWKLAKVGWPLDILRNGVVLIDSPGLNEHPVRQAITLENLSQADAIVFVQDCQAPASIDEVGFMNLYLDAYDVFFVFNKINYIPPDEVTEVKEEAIARVRQHRDEQRHDRYYFVNALAGLQARTANDTAAWNASAMAGFVEDLSAFLATERHRAKLVGSAREVVGEIRELRQLLPAQRALIQQKEADLRRRYDDAQAPLRRLGERAKQMRSDLENTQRHVQSLVRAEVASRLVRMSSEMPAIVADLTPEAELSLRPWKARGAAEEYAMELSQRASAEAAARYKAWQNEQFKALVEPELTAMARQADELFRGFMRDLTKIREDLTGLDLSARGDVSGLDGDGSLGGADLAGLDFTGGLAIGHLMTQIAATYGILLVWAFTPFGFVPLVIGVLLANAAVLGFAKGKLEQKVRKELSAELSRKVREDAEANADKAASAIRKTLGSAIAELMSRVEAELGQLRLQVEAALEALSEGTVAVQQSRDQLTAWEKTLEVSADAVDDLIADVALT